MTLSGVRGPDAGFALATSGLGSAVVLNVILWLALLVSIPAAGFNPLYVTAAIVGVFIMGVFAAIVIGLIKGEEAAERALRAVARRVKWLDEERTGAVVKRLAKRLRELLSDPQLLRGSSSGRPSTGCSTRRRCGSSCVPSAARCAPTACSSPSASPTCWPPCRSRRAASASSKVCCIPTLVGFGADRTSAALGVAAYRLVQYWMTLPVGGVAYCVLRYGPWSIDRARRLEKLRQVAEEAAQNAEGRLEWAERFGHKPGGPGTSRPATPTPLRVPPAEAASSVGAHDDPRAALRSLPRGLRRRRRVPALARARPSPSTTTTCSA